MLKISRKVEYSLMALDYMSHLEPHQVATAKEIAEAKNAPENLLSKILQNLSRHGWLESVRGVQGGYRLANPNWSNIPLIQLIENNGEKLEMVGCLTTGDMGCPQASTCEMQSPIAKLQNKIYEIFRKTSVGELVIHH